MKLIEIEQSVIMVLKCHWSHRTLTHTLCFAHYAGLLSRSYCTLQKSKEENSTTNDPTLSYRSGVISSRTLCIINNN